MKACWEISGLESMKAASGGRLRRRSSAAALPIRRRRRASRSQKIAPKLFTGRPATDTVSGNRTAHSLS